mmetsp:Transcript_4583/g.9849  ORF Transcript_4583/g.9849 Transcript_4583/m.9849 type:complete len:276 (-) Transcript_4583:236-1063(-)
MVSTIGGIMEERRHTVRLALATAPVQLATRRDPVSAVRSTLAVRAHVCVAAGCAVSRRMGGVREVVRDRIELIRVGVELPLGLILAVVEHDSGRLNHVIRALKFGLVVSLREALDPADVLKAISLFELRRVFRSTKDQVGRAGLHFLVRPAAAWPINVVVDVRQLRKIARGHRQGRQINAVLLFAEEIRVAHAVLDRNAPLEQEGHIVLIWQHKFGALLLAVGLEHLAVVAVERHLLAFVEVWLLVLDQARIGRVAGLFHACTVDAPDLLVPVVI